MTQEDKELLLKDLSARLPYGVIVKVSKEDNGSIKSYNKPFDVEIYNLLLLNGGYTERGIIYHYSQFSVKPYLRPMSSMTKEEATEYLNDMPYQQYIRVDWLNSHHFDYRGLIEKGLALEAPENMYKLD